MRSSPMLARIIVIGCVVVLCSLYLNAYPQDISGRSVAEETKLKMTDEQSQKAELLALRETVLRQQYQLLSVRMEEIKMKHVDALKARDDYFTTLCKNAGYDYPAGCNPAADLKHLVVTGKANKK